MGRYDYLVGYPKLFYKYDKFGDVATVLICDKINCETGSKLNYVPDLDTGLKYLPEVLEPYIADYERNKLKGCTLYTIQGIDFYCDWLHEELEKFCKGEKLDYGFEKGELICLSEDIDPHHESYLKLVLNYPMFDHRWKIFSDWSFQDFVTQARRLGGLFSLITTTVPYDNPEKYNVKNYIDPRDIHYERLDEGFDINGEEWVVKHRMPKTYFFDAVRFLDCLSKQKYEIDVQTLRDKRENEKSMLHHAVKY